eukprot:Gregarina_sp_Poly_1__6126@NODE_3237_length_1248_cov_29_548688_g2057_i0_p1_GENE_NODE_3237_length_1248_cov_29_548688_g2057_i0NODE_3237_length_1248_cov_29_548688_g2057_i0_p1_ORF_typecomplete_len363_score47_98_NODE_3237_length_1248_cov_29_548688_g2057_i01601131
MVEAGQVAGFRDFKLLIPSEASQDWAHGMDHEERALVKQIINGLADGKLIAKFVPRGLFTIDHPVWDCQTLVADSSFDGFEIKLTNDVFKSSEIQDAVENRGVTPSKSELLALMDFVHDCRDAELLAGQQSAKGGGLESGKRLHLGVSIDSELIDLELLQNTKMIDTLRQLRPDLDAISVHYANPATRQSLDEAQLNLTSPSKDSSYYPSVFVGLKSEHPTVAVDTLRAILGPKVGIELDGSAADLDKVMEDICKAERTTKFSGDITLLGWRGARASDQCAASAGDSLVGGAKSRELKRIKISDPLSLGHKNLRLNPRKHSGL